MRLGCLRYPHSERARLRAAYLESIYANCGTEWTAASAELTTAKASLDEHVEGYVKPSSLHLCHRILALPREVRDTIYSALLLTVFKTRRGEWYAGACNEFGNPELAHRSWDDDDALPIHRFGCASTSFRETAPWHLWDAAFVGPVVRRELVEAFYRVARFYLVFMCSTYHAGALEGMLREAVWDADVRPVDFIGNVVFRLGWREHLGCAKMFRRNTMFTAHLELDRFFVYNEPETLENFRLHMEELIALARIVRADGYRVRIFVEGEPLDLGVEIEDEGSERGQTPANPSWGGLLHVCESGG